MTFHFHIHHSSKEQCPLLMDTHGETSTRSRRHPSLLDLLHEKKESITWLFIKGTENYTKICHPTKMILVIKWAIYGTLSFHFKENILRFCFCQYLNMSIQENQNYPLHSCKNNKKHKYLIPFPGSRVKAPHVWMNNSLLRDFFVRWWNLFWITTI